MLKASLEGHVVFQGKYITRIYKKKMGYSRGIKFHLTPECWTVFQNDMAEINWDCSVPQATLAVC